MKSYKKMRRMGYVCLCLSIAIIAIFVIRPFGMSGNGASNFLAFGLVFVLFTVLLLYVSKPKSREQMDREETLELKAEELEEGKRFWYRFAQRDGSFSIKAIDPESSKLQSAYTRIHVDEVKKMLLLKEIKISNESEVRFILNLIEPKKS